MRGLITTKAETPEVATYTERHFQDAGKGQAMHHQSPKPQLAQEQITFGS